MTTPSRLRFDVGSEVGTLRRLFVHSPDKGIGRILPSKAQDWLFDDIVHLPTMRQEYDQYLLLLLYFLDPDKVRGRLAELTAPGYDRGFFKPGHPDFHASDRVVEIEQLLMDILAEGAVRDKLVAAACALERCSYATQELLLQLPAAHLARTLIAGSMPDGTMICAPIPNFIFTRDLGVVINEHLLLNKPARLARNRESMIAKFILYNHPLFAECRDQVLEIEHDNHFFLVPDSDRDVRRLTLEGGDTMMVSPDHLLLGISERTTALAVSQTIKMLFARNVVSKVTAVTIPAKRDYMHIDTIFTQVRRDTWVLLGALGRANTALEADHLVEVLTGRRSAEDIRILQFQKGKEDSPYEFDYLEDLFADISENDLHSGRPTQFIYAGQNQFPFGAREQWTDGCNLLAIREGVVVGYDRNDRTADSFRAAGFAVVRVEELLAQFERGQTDPAALRDTLITLPSAELSRARGGSHCMSFPLWREPLT